MPVKRTPCNHSTSAEPSCREILLLAWLLWHFLSTKHGVIENLQNNATRLCPKSIPLPLSPAVSPLLQSWLHLPLCFGFSCVSSSSSLFQSFLYFLFFLFVSVSLVFPLLDVTPSSFPFSWPNSLSNSFSWPRSLFISRLLTFLSHRLNDTRPSHLITSITSKLVWFKTDSKQRQNAVPLPLSLPPLSIYLSISPLFGSGIFPLSFRITLTIHVLPTESRPSLRNLCGSRRIRD